MYFYFLGDNSNDLHKYTTIINLFAIQPKSLQEGQLIISSPELSITEQFIDKKQIQLSNTFLKPPTLDVAMQVLDLPLNNTKGIYTILNKIYILEVNLIY